MRHRRAVRLARPEPRGARLSLAIDIDDVKAVLLADGWHKVVDGSFEVDAYEYLRLPRRPDGTYRDPHILYGDGAGFCFRTEADVEEDLYLAGPMSAILAVRHTV